MTDCYARKAVGLAGILIDAVCVLNFKRESQMIFSVSRECSRETQ